ncbi:MAG TPA: PKD domain-containing protein [Flavobacteriales bacterium]|jgi:subtilisin-like proprotein convertase family protein|nr:PKD domain-containing protein [Flavobacteriales bacterium]
MSGSAAACNGAIEDSGGPAGPYDDNEDFTFIMCPDQPGNVIYLEWVLFDLSTAGANMDELSIYDGDSATAPHLGTYTGQMLQDLIVSGTVFNTTGCLTLVFRSNNTGTGDFACAVHCTAPCTQPTAVITSAQDTTFLCQGGSVQFDGSASSPAAGQTLSSYIWEFGDGTSDTTTVPTLTHTYPAAGWFTPSLRVIDNVGCGSLNGAHVNVQVSTTPSFAGIVAPVAACPGETVRLTGAATPIGWESIIGSAFGHPVALPDDVGSVFSSSAMADGLSPGTLLTDVQQIRSLCVDMEHSYMGDLVLELIAPNGQSMLLHQQGGGGTYLGGAYDMDFMDPEPGTCWHYCWSPTATNGTWADNSAFGPTPNVITAGNPPSPALAPGTYEPTQPFSNLIGCPLNGVWSFQATDLWGADNGYICGWELQFDSFLGADTLAFTPTIGADADSSYWTGADIAMLSLNGDTAWITAGTPGDHSYTYHVLDNFGCTYDTTVVVSVQTTGITAIQGAAIVLAGEEEVYTSSDPQGTFAWTVEGGTILTGQGTSAITVEWVMPAGGSVTLVRTWASCTDTASLAIDMSTSVQERSAEAWSAFPVPVDERLIVTRPSAGAASWRLFDAAGRVVATAAFAADRGTIDTAGLGSGAYVLELVDAAGTQRRAILVQHR